MDQGDPGRHWDGQRWLRWDGASWVPEGGYPSALPPPAPGPSWSGTTAWSKPEPVGPHPPYATAPMPYAPGPPVYAPAYPLALTDQRNRSGMAVVAWIFTVLTGLYFLPWAIAATRGKSNAGSIGLINWLLGWTVVGWIVALVMACTAHRLLTPTYARRH